MKEWDSSNVIMTGNSDGVVRVRTAVLHVLSAHSKFLLSSICLQQAIKIVLNYMLSMCAYYGPLLNSSVFLWVLCIGKLLASERLALPTFLEQVRRDYSI